MTLGESLESSAKVVNNTITQKAYSLLYFITITIPSFTLNLLSYSIHIRLSFTTIAIVLFILLILGIGIIRYRAHTSYSKFKEDPLEETKKDETYIRDDINDKKRYGSGSYLDEFLIALKIFGYLEKNVFNELIKNMKTLKLRKNDIFNLDDNSGFVIVVEGNVQIYNKISTNNHSPKRSLSFQSDDIDFENNELLIDDDLLVEFHNAKYQLLNEVKSGNPLSSLVDILSLFTNEEELKSQSNSPKFMFQNPKSKFKSNNDIVPLNLDDTINTYQDSHPSTQPPNLIAKTTTNSTIAIIPAESFRRLRKYHPKPSAHIVQMILTRFYRATFQTAHNYLGLTKEIFETEIKLNKQVKLNFPKSLYDKVIKKIKQDLIIKNQPIQSQSEIQKNPYLGMKRKDSNLSLKDPGDLYLSNLRHPELISKDSSNSLFENQEYLLKISLIEGMFKFIGIDKDSFSLNSYSNGNNFSAFNSPMPFVVYQQEEEERSDSRKARTFSTTSSSKFEFTDYYESLNKEEDAQFNYDEILKDFANNVEFLQVESNKVLLQQNSSESNGLYYVVSGNLEVVYTDESTGNEKLVYNVKPGGVAGYLGCFFGSKSMVSIKVSKNSKECFIGYLSNKKMELLCEKYFMIYLNIAKSLIKSLNPKLLKLDSALEWIQLDAGDTLFKQDTDANGIYIMLNGRLRSFYENPETKEIKILNEYGQGQTFGEVEVLTAAKRSSTFIALRDSEAARIPRTYFEILALEHPSIMIKVSRIVASTIKQENAQTNDFNNLQTIKSLKIPTMNEILSRNAKSIGSNNKSNYRTITILPTRSGLPVTEFSIRLIQAFKNVNKKVIGLDQVSTLNHLGRYAFDKISRLKQSGFFSDLEEKYEIVVYIADTSINSNWTSTCIQQGDCILLLADALGDTNIGDFERLLLKTRSTVRTELILLHPERYVEPGLVNKWLKNRSWIDNHHHIKFNNLFRFKENQIINDNDFKNKFKEQINQLFPQFSSDLNNFTENLKNQVDFFLNPLNKLNNFNDQSSLILPHKNDFMRLARILSNQAVAVVLGGGGARGFSHLGVLKALEENGIPIDLIGGTSIGSFIGGLYAKEYDLVPIYGRSKKFAHRIGSIWRNLFDLTIPITSYTTGHEFNRGIWKVFGDSRIEDFWLNYYCNSTNITNSCMEIHTKGYAWRFIRASMSLAGLLPPITDKGSMLLDGGYVDNLPIDEMQKRGANVIFAVDVGSVDDRSPMNYGDSLSGFWIFVNRWNPFSNKPNIPTMSEIQLRLCYVSSVNALERVKMTPGVIYLRPPIENYATSDFGKFEEIYNVGSIYGDMVLKELISDNKLLDIAGIHNVNNKPLLKQRRNSV